MSEDLLPISIDEQIACVERELRMRHRVYPRWVEQGKMKPQQATRLIDAMLAVLDTLKRLRQEQRT